MEFRGNNLFDAFAKTFDRPIGPYDSPLDSRVVSATELSDNCKPVSVSHVLANPTEYDSQFICGTGLVSTLYTDIGETAHSLSSYGLEGEDSGNRHPYGAISTYVWYREDENLALYLGPRTGISFAGYFNVEDDCILGEIGTDREQAKMNELPYCRGGSLELDILELDFLD